MGKTGRIESDEALSLEGTAVKGRSSASLQIEVAAPEK